jgi:hypothetical protein
MVGKNANLSLPGETIFSVHAQILHIFLCQPLAPITLQNDNLGLNNINCVNSAFLHATDSNAHFSIFR